MKYIFLFILLFLKDLLYLFCAILTFIWCFKFFTYKDFLENIEEFKEELNSD